MLAPIPKKKESISTHSLEVLATAYLTLIAEGHQPPPSSMETLGEEVLLVLYGKEVFKWLEERVKERE